MADLILAPFLALVSPGFYRRIGQETLAHGLLYLAYLSFFFSLAIAALFLWRWMPAAEDIVTWSSERLPTVVFTRNGPVTDVAQPFELRHPEYGTLLVVDTGAEIPDPDRPAWLYLTGRELVLGVLASPRTREFRSLDVVPTSDERRRSWRDVIVNGPILERVYEDTMPFAPAVMLLAFPIFFVWKLLAAVAYSPLAVVANALLRRRMPYRQLLVLTTFAMTPVVMLEFVAMGGLANPVASSLRVSAGVTAAYVVAAVLCARRVAGPRRAAVIADPARGRERWRRSGGGQGRMGVGKSAGGPRPRRPSR